MSDTSKTQQDAPISENGYRVLARKYRPSSFVDLIGQQPMVQTLSNAFETGRIAQAYMLTGVRGVGKTTTARILARALNYETDAIRQPSLDLTVPGIHCTSIMEGNHVDVIEMDAASHTGIGDIREIIASVRYKPVSARYKVYIIDEVHMLSNQAFNGLLKTLEEPPEHVKFIFATTEIRKVPITVLSRCQRFDLRRIESGEMTAHLAKIAEAEKIEVESEALAMIARAGEGSVRDCLSLMDQAIAHASGSGSGKVEAIAVRYMLGLADRARVIDLFEQVMKGDIASALGELKEQYDTGAEPATVLSDLAEFVHFVTRLRYVETALDDPSLSEDEKIRGKAFAETLSPRVLGRAWQMLLKGIEEVKAAPRPLATADMVLVRITHAADLPTPDEAVRMAIDQPSGSGPSMGGGGGASGGGTTSSQSSPPSNLTTGPNGGARMRQAGGPVLMVDNSAQPSEIAPLPQATYERIETFEQFLDAAEKKRDIKFKLLLRNNVSVVHMEKGRLELAPVGDAPRDLLNQMSTRLLEWTGDQWMVVLSEAQGAVTIRDREEAERAALMEDAEQHPVVAAILNTFPKSKIVDIRLKKEAEVTSDEVIPLDPDQEMADDNTPPAPDGLDDYFDT